MDYGRGSLSCSSSPIFADLRAALGPYLVDKTKLIEKMFTTRRLLRSHIDLVLRPRCSGKSTMLHMLRSFFSVRRNGDPDPSLLFEGLDIASKKDICSEHMGKYPVIFCDFKRLSGDTWEDMLLEFKELVSDLYREWEDCLTPTLTPENGTYFESICLKTATDNDFQRSLFKLSQYLAQKFDRGVIVLIDENESPNNRAYEHGYFDEANDFFWRGALPLLLKENQSLQYAALAGVTPTSTAKSGWHSCVNNIETHALHRGGSIFAGMLLFTESEVIRLKTLSNSKLRLEDLKAHYRCYIAAGSISVYNPVSVMSAFEASSIENFWIATGEYPLSNREFPDKGLNAIERLLAGSEIEFQLEENVQYSSLTLSKNATLTLMYYGGYLTMTTPDRFKIPNQEVMTDWARWMDHRRCRRLEGSPTVSGGSDKGV